MKGKIYVITTKHNEGSKRKNKKEVNRNKQLIKRQEICNSKICFPKSN